MHNPTAVALTKQSSQPEIRTYFEAVMRLANGNEQFPVNLDEVWPLVYTEKSKAVAALRKNFIENEDFTTLARKVERQIVHDYFLSVSCLEYFIARKVRPVFEVYRQVFHKVTTPKQLTQSEIVGFQIPAVFF